VLVNGHAHNDHAGGLAQLRKDSGGKLWASAGDRWALEHGRHRGDDDYGGATFPPVKVDHVVADGETVRLRDIQLTAHLTPGHTPGCTTWSLPVRDGARTLQVLFAGCFSNGGNILVGNKVYPGIVSDYRASYRKLRAMHADVVLPEHPDFVDLLGREKKAQAGDKDAFVDPAELNHILAWAEPGFDKELAKEEAAKRK
jgi:metallo-beta-lactamase class B